MELFNNVYFKLSVIIIIGLLLLIPAMMVKNLIVQKESIHQDAITEVSSKWGGKQTIVGPFLTIPKHVYNIDKSQKDSVAKVLRTVENINFLPNELKINGVINPERRYRGIYEIVVYNSNIDVSGYFDLSEIIDKSDDFQQLQFDDSFITVGIDDLQGIKKNVVLNWNNKEYLFNPGVYNDDVVSSGINTPVKITKIDSTLYEFSFNLELNGSQHLYFAPFGKNTTVELKSTWSNPSFSGAYLPDSREINEKGFTAKWNILHLNRNYPQTWVGQYSSINESFFGTQLLIPVDNYQKTYRAVRYAILFIGLTFLAFFFVEVFNKVLIHPIHYILIGIALVVFFTLLLSISEHLNFNLSFVVSAMATVLLISGYSKSILKSPKLASLIAVFLIILYSFIFVLIQLQDLSLLLGSIGVFTIIAFVMYFSRNIDWNNVFLKSE